VVDQVAEHIITVRQASAALLVVLTARACGQQGVSISRLPRSSSSSYGNLLHDDVVDGSSLRRGRDTANEVYGNQASVLVGDFVYSRAFQMMAGLACQPVMEIMARPPTSSPRAKCCS